MMPQVLPLPHDSFGLCISVKVPPLPDVTWKLWLTGVAAA